MGLRPQVALTTPVLVGTDGHMRMAKSTGNYIGIDETPEEMYGKVMSLPDSAMMNYFRLVTRFSPEEIVEIERGLDEGKLHPRDVKMRLAREIVAIYQGDEKVEPAEAAFRRVFQEQEDPEEMPEYSILSAGTIVDVMVDSGLVSSKSEARRLIKQNGVRLDGEVLDDPNMALNIKQPVILKVGKRRFLRLMP
jgi:tyrosyl-tRNA synthetase